MESRRTDLALEARELYQEQTLREPPGVDWKEEEQDGIHMTEVHIRTPEGAREMDKPQGRYITFQLGEHWEREDHTIAAASSLLARQVRRLLPSQPESVLVVGLGNRHLTADALGPLCTEKIIVTRHLKDTMPDVFRSFARVSAIAPGVLGLTGVETGEVVAGAVRKDPSRRHHRHRLAGVPKALPALPHHSALRHRHHSRRRHRPRPFPFG